MTHKRKQSLADFPRQFNQTSPRDYVAKPVPLILYNQETQKFEIQPEAKQLASLFKKPIAVVSVVGMYRTGKSYLLNRVLLNKKAGEKGFGVGPTINPCTKGLWMWGTPVKATTKSGEEIDTIIMDTEGIGGMDEDQNHDMRIFTLALLLSSYLIYNSMGSIDEAALQSLGFVTQIGQHIAIKSGKEDIAHLMPKFMWVIRDFSLQLIDEQGKDISSREYLERALQDYVATGEVSERFAEEMGKRNEVKQVIRKFF